MMTLRSWCYLAGCIVGILVFGVLLKTTIKRVTYKDNYQVGCSEFLSGNYSSSVDALEKIKSLYPRNSEIDPFLAAAFYYNRNYKKAESIFKEVDTPSSKAGFILSEYAFKNSKNKMNDTDNAGYIEKLKAVKSDEPNILANTAGIAALMNLSKEDIETNIKLIKEKILGNKNIRPRPLSLAYNTLGCLYAKLEKYEEALGYFQCAGKFISLREVEALLKQNHAVVWIVNETLRPEPVATKLMDVPKYIKKLKNEQKPLAKIGLAKAYLAIGDIKEARKILESFKNPSAEIDRKLTNLKMQMFRYEGMKDNRKKEEAFANLSILIEKILELVEKGDKEFAAAYDIKSMLYFLAGFYYAQNQNDKMEKILKKGRVLFPDNYSFLRNEGVLKIQKGDVESGLDLIGQSYKKNSKQNDVVSFKDKLNANININSFRVFSGDPFSHRSPLIHIGFKKNPHQPSPRIEKLTIGDKPLESIVFGTYILARPRTPLPEGFSDYTVNLETANPSSGSKKTHKLTTQQDLTRPEINIIIPAKGSSVSRFNFELKITVSDKGSGLDMSTLNVSVQPASEKGERFKSYVVKNGVYYRVRRNKGKKIDPAGKIEAIVPLPVAGGYILRVQVSDKEFNIKRISDWKFTAE
ncbi:tetratricopeptide repeat protein [Planctomycetota bacterium]